MIGLGSQYGFNLVLSASVMLVSAVVALAIALHMRARHRPALPIAARILTAGSAILIVAATAFPSRWPIQWRENGDLILELGMGGLRFWSSELTRFPDTLASILLVANVAAYVPLGFFAGWARIAAAGSCLGSWDCR